MLSGGNLVDISVVIPTKNEEITIGQFLDWVKIGAERNKVTYEVILIDNSTDKTPEIAKALGAQVVKVDKPGLGLAYNAAKQFINGNYVFLGDADCTYDFREIASFLESLNKGFDFVIGNRFKGIIEKNAMPKHHQYFGSPLTSLWFKVLLGIPTGDIHCGIRALRKELYIQLPFHEQGWEYASEMIVSARNLGAKIHEIPVRFYKEPPGRISHHKRNGWLTPFKAGWGTLRVTWMFSFDRLLTKPGYYLGVAAVSLVAFFTILPIRVLEKFEIGFSALLLTSLIAIVGFSLYGVGKISSFTYREKSQNDARENLLADLKRTFNVWAINSALLLVASVTSIITWRLGYFSNKFNYAQSFRFIATYSVILDLWFMSTIAFLVTSLKRIRI